LRKPKRRQKRAYGGLETAYILFPSPFNETAVSQIDSSKEKSSDEKCTRKILAHF